ncbi:hypothetical protein BRARA_G03343 [Brassica rapa]|uniref:BnaA07g32050D protein n=3 Tax=Brassica TaxID=3705 RepID=A0A078I3J7_BRANA|nr:zinc finger CCCH domain-containing protein 16 isoform X1 [Brassica napus]RID56120.1 hypothetical protein BRARA_G03343 [Brassica rapa]KAH0920169.1 hypothetical protein HID58_027829 [Brassica napus]CAF2201280.1 unnamed protein product [Brassica napus]CAG7904662.1 unnamed protein product [Brassica rapa]CDY45425.1 BnaA07g32050D [Brassica napus]
MRKELCRNFQQGSCRYGERCRYLHPQQTKPNNPFGFGTQQQQNKTSNNPFGFGVQGGSNSNRPNQSQQPFQNTWQRNPSSGSGASTQQSGKQTQQADHKCTDPAACKRVIQEDLKNERPMWKLTCYAHCKHLPCDVSGDVSYEELRAMAYEESKRGIPLQSIVERERNLQNAKVAEFENFLRSPYRGAVTANQTPSIFPPATQVNSSPPGGFSAFNQQPAFPNTNAGGGGPPNPFGRFNQQPNAFSVNTPQPAPSGPSGFQSQPSSFGPGPAAPSAFQPSVSFKPASFGPGPVAPSGFQSQPASFGPGPGLSTPPQNSSIFPSVTPTPAFNSNQNNQTGFSFNSPVASFTSPAVDTTNTPSGTELQAGGAPVDTSIWLKEKWNPGEIPEQAPPDAFVHR